MFMQINDFSIGCNNLFLLVQHTDLNFQGL
jgi:hypothetical protein